MLCVVVVADADDVDIDVVFVAFVDGNYVFVREAGTCYYCLVNGVGNWQLAHFSFADRFQHHLALSSVQDRMNIDFTLCCSSDRLVLSSRQA